MKHTLVVVTLLFLHFISFGQGYSIYQTIKVDGNNPELNGLIDSNDQFGQGVSAIQDLDGDGIQEILVGSSLDDEGGLDIGAVYVLFMNADHTVKKYNKIIPGKGALTGMSDFSGLFGGFVTRLDDVNGDGIDDIAVGEPRNGSQGRRVGKIWIIFLNNQGEATGYKSITYGDPNFAATPPATDIRFGTQITSLGDIDGDKVTDIAVGEAFSPPSRTGAVYIIFLNSDGSVKDYQRIANNQGGLPPVLSRGDDFGISVGAIGDLNNDGVTELVVGARYDDDGLTDSGAVYVLFLNSDGTVNFYNKISASNAMAGLLDSDDRFGISVNSIDDINKDGTNDIIVGAYKDDDGGENKGAVYLLLLNNEGGIKEILKFSMTSGGLNSTLQSDGEFSWTIAALSDNDSNGYPELLVSAFSENINSVDDGAFYILPLERPCTETAADAGSDKVECSDNRTQLGAATLEENTSGAWSIISGKGTFLNMTDPNSLVEDLGSGINVFRWTVTNNFGCEYVDEVEVFYNEQSAYAGEDVAVCEISSASLSAELPAGYQGVWQIVEGQGTIRNRNDPATLVSDLGNGYNLFRWTITGLRGCRYSDEVAVLFQNSGDISVSPIDCSLQNFYLSVPSAIDGFSGSWSLLLDGTPYPEAEFEPDSSVTTVRGVPYGEITFVYEYSGTGCSPVVSVTIDNAEPKFPNVITPNGDSFNENFVLPQAYLEQENTLSLFNRWGKPVYVVENYDNTFNGSKLVNGTYYYEFYTSLCEDPVVGWLHILK
ncbi:MAG: gliding motility-associated C-terminal domain-containing protein [Cyclobacteriaceae bacterium]